MLMNKQKDVFVLTNFEILELKKGKKRLTWIPRLPRIVVTAKSYKEVADKIGGRLFTGMLYGFFRKNFVMLYLSEIEKDERWEENPERSSLYREGCKVFKLKNSKRKTNDIVFGPPGITWGETPFYNEPDNIPFVALECCKTPLVEVRII